MPELPEVETVARSLVEGQGMGEGILGRRIAGAQINWSKSIATPSVNEFRQRIRGQEVRGVGRRGKYIRIDLSEDVLLVHLRMSGDLMLGDGGEVPGRFSRVLIDFEDGTQLSFNDARKFGRIWLLDEPEDELSKLGPEPFDRSLTAKSFHEMLAGKSRQLKPLLLDQGFIAGLGNIYVDEALHFAKLHPLQQSDQISKEQAAELLKGIRKVLRDSIKANGSSFDWVYRGGNFQNKFKVYQQAGEPCPRCGTPIERIVVGQRGTHICPSCQNLA